MKDQTPWTGNAQEIKAQDDKMLEMSKILEDYMEHKFDVITDSDWFVDLVEEKIKKLLTEEEAKRGIYSD